MGSVGEEVEGSEGEEEEEEEEGDEEEAFCVFPEDDELFEADPLCCCCEEEEEDDDEEEEEEEDGEDEERYSPDAIETINCNNFSKCDSSFNPQSNHLNSQAITSPLSHQLERRQRMRIFSRAIATPGDERTLSHTPRREEISSLQ